MSNFCPDTRGKGGHLFRLTCSVVLWGGRNIANKNITGVCGECLQCMDHTEFAPAHWHFPGVLSRSTLLRLQVALQGNCPKWALNFVYFPGLSCSGSASQVLHKGTDMAGPVFCALPSLEQLRQPGVWQVHLPRWAVSLNHHLILATWFPGCTVRVPSQVPCVSSGELI